MKIPELLMPAGDLEKAKIAYQFGAQACYGSTSAFSMRTREIGFNYETLKEAIDYAHSIGKKFYVTLNTYPHEFELAGLKKHAKKLLSMKPDAIILADPGIFAFVKKEIKKVIARSEATKQSGIEIHLSTQANTTNSESIKFWHKLGVKRFILAREISIQEIEKIVKNVPKTAVIETFVHGAMCNSISGRCNLSNYLTDRDANRGACVQSCRWKYNLVEESRPNQFIPVSEDENGSYIFNSKDLCMIEHLEKLANAGIQSFKVEGRNKSIYYAAIVARAYRKAINNLTPTVIASEAKQSYNSDIQHFKSNNKIIKSLTCELNTVTSRGYSTGFYFGKPNDEDINYETSRPTSDWQFVGIVKEVIENSSSKSFIIPTEVEGSLSQNEIATPLADGAMARNDKLKKYLIEARNEILPKTQVEIVTPDEIYKLKINKIISPSGEILIKANPNTKFILETKFDLEVNSVLRAKK